MVSKMTFTFGFMALGLFAASILFEPEFLRNRVHGNNPDVVEGAKVILKHWDRFEKASRKSGPVPYMTRLWNFHERNEWIFELLQFNGIGPSIFSDPAFLDSSQYWRRYFGGQSLRDNLLEIIEVNGSGEGHERYLKECPKTKVGWTKERDEDHACMVRFFAVQETLSRLKQLQNEQKSTDMLLTVACKSASTRPGWCSGKSPAVMPSAEELKEVLKTKTLDQLLEYTRYIPGPAILYFDLNKTILAADEVKGFGRVEIMYLERFKNDKPYLQWLWDKGEKIGDQKNPMFDFKDGDFETWYTSDAKEGKTKKSFIGSKNERNIIEAAKLFAEAHAPIKREMDHALAQVRDDNSVDSFWKMLRHLQDYSSRRSIIMFRTFGTDLPDMFRFVEENGFGDSLLPEAKRHWTMIHKLPQGWKENFYANWKSKVSSEEKSKLKLPEDWETRVQNPDAMLSVVNSDVATGDLGQYLTPLKPAAAPEDKKPRDSIPADIKDDFNLRTVFWEEFARVTDLEKPSFVMKNLLSLLPSGTKPHPRFGWKMLSAKEVSTAHENMRKQGIHAIEDLPRMIQEAASEVEGSLAIMGMNDNYKPWSRKNTLNGKSFFGNDDPQMFFDDYCFSRSQQEGSYVAAVWAKDASGKIVEVTEKGEGAKDRMIEKFDGTRLTATGGVPAGKHPSIHLFQAYIKDAVEDPDYFLNKIKPIYKHSKDQF